MSQPHEYKGPQLSTSGILISTYYLTPPLSGTLTILISTPSRVSRLTAQPAMIVRTRVAKRLELSCSEGQGINTNRNCRAGVAAPTEQNSKVRIRHLQLQGLPTFAHAKIRFLENNQAELPLIMQLIFAKKRVAFVLWRAKRGFKVRSI
jgi:hypothetical protein